ncbi:hypothetical protein CEB3_c13900 [Peptococcaceae bacterium CEB3]|nr:hypothetical protein CEB3_c13900 [Peptococcaceae bacterium CEB3]
MPNQTDIAGRLEQAGLDDFCIDWDQGIALVYFRGREKPADTDESRKEKQVPECVSEP